MKSFLSLFSSPLIEYRQSMRRLWLSAETALSFIVNSILLSAAWLLFPLENEGWASIRRNAHFWFPQVNFKSLRTLDCLRMLIQALFMLITPLKGSLPPKLITRSGD